MVVRPRFRAAVACLALGLMSWLAGCASPGQPQPPSLHLPGPVTNLVAERVGNEVRLTWDMPAISTQGDALRGPVTATLCRESGAATTAPAAATPASKSQRARGRKGSAATPAASAPACSAVQQFVVTPGPGHAVDPLSQALLAGPPTLLTYRVDLRNDRQRSAGPSAPAFSAAGPAPAGAGPLTLVPHREGILVRWTPRPSDAGMELRRTLVNASAEASATKVRGALPMGNSAARSTPREVSLQAVTAGAGGTTGTDAGGMLDRTARNGEMYSYIAQRVSTLTLAGRRLEVRGVASPAASITFRDTFPPQPPTGLVSIPGGGFGAGASIDLSWDAGPEADLLGYYVYRGIDGAAFERVTSAPVSVPAFRDLHVVAGHRYTYRVTALDQRRNESAAGASVEETLRN